MTRREIFSINASHWEQTILSANILSGLRILLLEDEFLIAMDVELLCREHGAADVIVKQSLEGLEDDEALAGFDVAIIDLMLSGVSTLPFASRLARRGRPFVFASGYVDIGELSKDFPGVPVVGKPYTGADLIGAVAAVTRRS
jgi:CheY-like chemotaxis protein